LPIGRFAAKGLQELGHLVEVFESPLFYSAFEGLKQLKVSSNSLEQLEQGFLQVVARAIYAKIEAFDPSLVLALAQAPLTRQLLTKLRQQGLPTAMWFVEDHQVFKYWRAFAPLYDFFAVIQKEPFWSALRQIKVDKICYLPLACNPDVHKPLKLTPVEKKRFGSDLSFMGAGYPNRRKAFKELLTYDFKIWGTEWDGDPVLEPFVQENGRRVSTEETVKIFNASKINLNLHSSIQDKELITGGDFVNPRTFEIAGCKSFQLVDKRTLLPELFDLQTEMTVFSSLKELKQKIDYYLKHPQERKALAEAAYARVNKDHTYKNRMALLLEFIQSYVQLKPVPKQPIKQLVNQDLQTECAALLEELGLDWTSDFEEIIFKIRQKQGQLTPVETAFLFLDEWKRQYLQT